MAKIAFEKAVVTLVTAGCVAGCMHQRVTQMVTVQDIGPQIVTKNKYTMVSSDGIDGIHSLSAMCTDVALDMLIAAQPQVFCSNGIPFTVKHERGLTPKSRNVPLIIPVLMPFIIPGGGKGLTTEFQYTIDVVDCPDAHATFRKKERSDGCFAILSPLPMLFYPTAGSFDDEPENNCKFTQHYYSLGFTSDTESLKKIASASQSATAYGIAAVLKQMEESGKIKPANSRSVVDVKLQNANLLGGYNFDVVDLHRTDSDSYRYVFSLVSASKYASLRQSLAARRVLRDTIRHDFTVSYPSVNRTVLAVDFVKYEFANGVIKGVADVLPLNILAYNYDKHTRKGCMRIKVRADQFDAARQYVRQNVELIARDKNIALIVGEIPPDARFYLLDESLDDGVLVINFKTE